MPTTPFSVPMTPMATGSVGGGPSRGQPVMMVGNGQPTNVPANTAGAPRKAGVNVANSFKRPEEVLSSIENISEYKMNLRPDKTFVLAIMAGVYIALGTLVAIMVGGGAPGVGATDPGLQKWLYAFMFPFGLVLVVIVGGELGTSSYSIMPVGWLAQRVSTWKVIRHWMIAYGGNLLGSLFVAGILIKCSEISASAPFADFLINGALKKVHLTWTESVIRGIGCNVLVCLAVWSAQAAEDITGKILALWFPIAAFVAIGFEHSVAQMAFIPAAMMLGAPITVGEFLGHALIPVTIGNIIGGLLVALPYWYVYWLPNHPIAIHKCDLGLDHCFRRQHPERAAAIEAAIAAKKANAAPTSPCPAGIKGGACASAACCGSAKATKVDFKMADPPAAGTGSAATSTTVSAVPSAAGSVCEDAEAHVPPSPVHLAHIAVPKEPIAM